MLKVIESKYLKNDIPDFRPGDNIKVYVKIKEGDKERIQVFQGDVSPAKVPASPVLLRFARYRRVSE
jgi:ribosomal protein L19